MKEINISLTTQNFNSAENFSTFRNECKSYLTFVSKNWDKFTMVSHDSFIGYITENAIKKYLKEKYHNLVVETWEEQFDLNKIKNIIREEKNDEDSINLVVSYFYDSWDLIIKGEKENLYLDVKTALTKKEPNNSWNFLYPVVQATKGGKDMMILVYYVVNSITDLRSFSKLVLVGGITPEKIKTCNIIRAGDRTRFRTISQIDNYETELGIHYSDIEGFIKDQN